MAQFPYQHVTDLQAAQKNFEFLQSILAGLGKRVRVYNSSDQTIPTSTETALEFDSEEYDTEFDIETMHDPADPTRLHIKTAGVYDFYANVAFDDTAAGSGERSVQIRLNGSENIATVNEEATGLTTDWLLASGQWLFEVGDYVEVVVFHDFGSDLNVIASPSTSPVFSLKWGSP